jgi:hypothetical protein
MVARQNYKGRYQVIPELQILQTISTFGAAQVVVYTVPAGKKALVEGATIQYVSLGTSTFFSLRVNTTELRRLAAANTTIATDLQGCVLMPGDTINFIGDAGNTGVVRVLLSILELPQ